MVPEVPPALGALSIAIRVSLQMRRILLESTGTYCLKYTFFLTAVLSTKGIRRRSSTVLAGLVSWQSESVWLGESPRTLSYIAVDPVLLIQFTYNFGTYNFVVALLTLVFSDSSVEN